MSDTPETHLTAPKQTTQTTATTPDAPTPTRRVSMLWPCDLHAAMTTAASVHRRDFTHEVLTACDEHLARVANKGGALPVSSTPTTPIKHTTHATE